MELRRIHAHAVLLKQGLGLEAQFRRWGLWATIEDKWSTRGVQEQTVGTRAVATRCDLKLYIYIVQLALTGLQPVQGKYVRDDCPIT